MILLKTSIESILAWLGTASLVLGYFISIAVLVLIAAFMFIMLCGAILAIGHEILPEARHTPIRGFNVAAPFPPTYDEPQEGGTDDLPF